MKKLDTVIMKKKQKRIFYERRVLKRISDECKGEDFKPIKCFSIDRVFRNETLDSTHLAEFHQIEGFIADKNIGLPELMAIINEFFKRI